MCYEHILKKEQKLSDAKLATYFSKLICKMKTVGLFDLNKSIKNDIKGFFQSFSWLVIFFFLVFLSKKAHKF